MTIAVVTSKGRISNDVVRPPDGRRHNLVIYCPWGQPLEETFLCIRDQLSDAEAVAVWSAFHMGQAADRSPA